MRARDEIIEQIREGAEVRKWSDVNSHPAAECDDDSEEYQLGYEDAVEMVLEEAEDTLDAWADEYERMEDFIAALRDAQAAGHFGLVHDLWEKFDLHTYDPYQALPPDDIKEWWVGGRQRIRGAI